MNEVRDKVAGLDGWEQIAGLWYHEARDKWPEHHDVPDTLTACAARASGRDVRLLPRGDNAT